MLGVVIWSDVAEQKAIIWCEDHGELAFLANSAHPAANAERFDEGDLIQFDLAEHRNLRLARNPRKIAGHYCSDLGEVITKATQIRSEIERQSASGQADLVDLSRARQERKRSKDGKAA